MFEYHGWLVVELDTPIDRWKETDGDLHELRMEQFIQSLDDKINEFEDMSRCAHKFRSGQWKYFYSFQALHNHCVDWIYELFHWVSQNSKGSYGILYTSDGEGEFPFEFRVWVLRGNSFTEHGDPFLSPRLAHIGFPSRGKDHPYEEGIL